MSDHHQPVGVVGSGSFGTAVSNVLSKNRKVLLYSRRKEVVETIIETGEHKGKKLSENIVPTNDLEEIAKSCTIIFPIVPAAHFRQMMKEFSPFLKPYHILIHGTKGLDSPPSFLPRGKDESSHPAAAEHPAGQAGAVAQPLSREQVRTMSEVILEESVVKRVGCFSGPNLARELNDDQLAATVVASKFDEVIKEGQKALASQRFKVYGSYELTGIELAGALKNVIAIASGAICGLGYGKNAEGMLLSRGLAEITTLGKALGGSTQAFLGLAGVGDLIATCSSPLSRNFSVGYGLAKGKKLNEILLGMDDVAEGVHTIPIIKSLADYYSVRAPITQTLYKILFFGFSLEEGISFLMNYPLTKDVDFL